ncbi:MAG: sigma-54 dependent transcriptional regulator [Acidobacteriota bacterium]
MSAPASPESDHPRGERILVVEDDADQRRLVASMLRRAGYAVSEAESFRAAESALARLPLDLVLADWQLGDGDGSALLAAVRAERPDVAFVMVTAYGTIARAVAAVRAGADDYLAKPFEREALLLALDRALAARRLTAENRRLTEALGERDRLVDLVGRAPSMQRLYRRMEKLAGTDATVLLTGESGTGKELAARALHTLSRRSAGPFVVVNCGAIPEGLIESELFGVEKGAYTGADRTRPGKIEAARGGTFFLDEVGELPLALQPALLRMLQEGTSTRVGGIEETRADVRIIAATNRDLQAEAAEGRFREDLYYRLAVVPLTMPPLRERRDDLPLLIDHFATRAARRHGVALAPFSSALRRHLLDHAWPGNVRELANAIERLVLLAEDGVAAVDDLPPEILTPQRAPGAFTVPPGGLSWEAHERDCLRQALELGHGNRAAAARLLDLPYKAFLYRLEKHGLA